METPMKQFIVTAFTFLALAHALAPSASAVGIRDYWLKKRIHIDRVVNRELKTKIGWTITLNHSECVDAQSILNAVKQVVQHPQIAVGVLTAIAKTHDADKGKGMEMDVLYSGQVVSVRTIN
jgi:hypothetical protein